MNQIVIEVWGDLALFTMPVSKVERLTYPVPTPSAMRGLLAAIYSKPEEFYWQINRIEVLNPIRYISFRRNEVKDREGKNPMLVEESRTQRNSVFLKDVRYRLYASIVRRNSFTGTDEQLYSQAMRRIRSGKCFYTPYLGTRECIAYFEESDGKREKISDSMDIGIMLYDVFDLNDASVSPKPSVSLFSAKMTNGVIEIPEFESSLVLKGVKLNHAEGTV